MTWLGLFRGNQAKAMPAAMAAERVYQDPNALTEEEMFAVIAAVIAEFEGNDEFQVVSIRQRSRNWSVFGRAELMRSRL